jgi:hypothetical protein
MEFALGEKVAERPPPWQAELILEKAAVTGG